MVKRRGSSGGLSRPLFWAVLAHVVLILLLTVGIDLWKDEPVRPAGQPIEAEVIDPAALDAARERIDAAEKARAQADRARQAKVEEEQRRIEELQRQREREQERAQAAAEQRQQEEAAAAKAAEQAQRERERAASRAGRAGKAAGRGDVPLRKKRRQPRRSPTRPRRRKPPPPRRQQKKPRPMPNDRRMPAPPRRRPSRNASRIRPPRQRPQKAAADEGSRSESGSGQSRSATGGRRQGSRGQGRRRSGGRRAGSGRGRRAGQPDQRLRRGHPAPGAGALAQAAELAAGPALRAARETAAQRRGDQRAGGGCGGDPAFVESVEQAVMAASPLQVPTDIRLFNEHFRNFIFEFKADAG